MSKLPRLKLRDRQCRYPALFGMLVAILVVATPASAGVIVSVDKSAQRMVVTVDGVVRYRWAVSTGRKGYATPSGQFQAFRMEADHYSKEWDEAPMPHAIFFTAKGHAIHGSYDVKRLGRVASHGCVRLSPANAATLFALVKARGLSNTKVVLNRDSPAAAPLLARRKLPKNQDLDEAAPTTFGQIESRPANALQPAWSGSADYYQSRPASLAFPN